MFVGLYFLNGYGFFDMIVNVWEWMIDFYMFWYVWFFDYLVDVGKWINFFVVVSV